jgi:hypothetical protein
MNPYQTSLGAQDPVVALSETPERIRELIGRMGRADFTRPLAPGKWNAREILVHLAHTELAFGFRVRLALSTEAYVVQPLIRTRSRRANLWSRPGRAGCVLRDAALEPAAVSQPGCRRACEVVAPPGARPDDNRHVPVARRVSCTTAPLEQIASQTGNDADIVRGHAGLNLTANHDFARSSRPGHGNLTARVAPWVSTPGVPESRAALAGSGIRQHDEDTLR